LRLPTASVVSIKTFPAATLSLIKLPQGMEPKKCVEEIVISQEYIERIELPKSQLEQKYLSCSANYNESP